MDHRTILFDDMTDGALQLQSVNESEPPGVSGDQLLVSARSFEEFGQSVVDLF